MLVNSAPVDNIPSSPSPQNLGGLAAEIAALEAEHAKPSATEPEAKPAPKSDPAEKLGEEEESKPEAKESDGWDDGLSEEPDDEPEEGTPEHEIAEKAKAEGKKPFWRERLDKKNEHIAKITAEKAAVEAELQRYRSGAPVQPTQPVPAQAAPQAPQYEQVLQYVEQNDPNVRAVAAAVAQIEANSNQYATQAEFDIAHNRALARFEYIRGESARQVIDGYTRQAQQQASTAENVVTDYIKTVEASTIPGAKIGLQRFRAVATTLPEQFIDAVVRHESRDIATAALTEKKADFDRITSLARTNPTGAILALGERIASYKASRSPERQAAARAAVEEAIPAQPRSSTRAAPTQSAKKDDPFAHARNILSGRAKDDIH